MTTLPIRDTDEKRLEDYRPVVGDRVIEEILALAGPLRGVRVLHVNSSGFGGGVADLLEALVPLMNDIGLQVEWRTIRGSNSFFDVTKAMHNSLQGKPVRWTAAMWDIWLKFNQQNAEELDRITTLSSSTIPSPHRCCIIFASAVIRARPDGSGDVIST